MAILKRNKRVIYGLTDDLEQINLDITSLTDAREAADGDLATLQTENTANLVGAINSLLADVNSGSDASLEIAENLADLADATVARTNLGVYSQEQVDTAIQAAQADLGTNFRVADITARDALMGLDTNDRVFVADQGDGSWATYKPTAFDGGTGAVTEWTQLMSQYSLESVISAAAMRTEYASNADTNVYVDADKAKVDFVTVTEAIDLDDMGLKAELGQDLMGINSDATEIPSADSVRPYLDEAGRISGTRTTREVVTVMGDTITLTHAPKGGKAGIMNFATVRWIDSNGVSWDAPLTSTANPNEFIVNPGTAGQWDGNSVIVQYAHIPTVQDVPNVDEQGYIDQGTLNDPN